MWLHLSFYEFMRWRGQEWRTNGVRQAGRQKYIEHICVPEGQDENYDDLHVVFSRDRVSSYEDHEVFSFDIQFRSTVFCS